MLKTWLVLSVSFFAVYLISLSAAAQVRRHIGQRFAPYVHLFVAAVCGGYLVDALSSARSSAGRPFLAFWSLLVLIQTGLFFRALLRRSRQYASKEGNG